MRRLLTTSLGTVEVDLFDKEMTEVVLFDDEGWESKHELALSAMGEALTAIGLPEGEARGLEAETLAHERARAAVREAEVSLAFFLVFLLLTVGVWIVGAVTLVLLVIRAF